MDEAGWLRSEGPQAMLTFLRGHEANLAEGIGGGRYVLSDRKLRLFACALWRRRWDRKGVDDRALTACAAAEAFADGLLDGPGLCRAYDECWLPMHPPEDRRQSRLLCSAMAREAASALLLGASPIDQHMDEAGAAKLLREIVGNPFRPVTLPLGPLHKMLCGGCGRDGLAPVKKNTFPVPLSKCLNCFWDGPPWPDVVKPGPCPWLTPLVRRLAQIAYDGDMSAYLPLADALEEQGLPDGDLLRHLRGWEECPSCDVRGTRPPPPFAGAQVRMPCRCSDDGRSDGWIAIRSPHVKGCWALSLLLGKE